MNRFILITIVILSSMVSCSEDSYYGNSEQDNILEGIWDNYDDTGYLMNRKVYTADRYAYFSIIDGLEVTDVEWQHYTINNNQLIYRRYTQTFKIDSDTLWITNSTGSQITKYIRSKNIIR